MNDSMYCGEGYIIVSVKKDGEDTYAIVPSSIDIEELDIFAELKDCEDYILSETKARFKELNGEGEITGLVDYREYMDWTFYDDGRDERYESYRKSKHLKYNAMSEAKMTVEDTIYELKRQIKQTFSYDEMRVEKNGAGLDLMVKDLGHWGPNPYDDDDDDYDRYVPDFETEEKLDEIVSKVKKISGQRISWSPDEKFWLTIYVG